MHVLRPSPEVKDDITLRDDASSIVKLASAVHPTRWPLSTITVSSLEMVWVNTRPNPGAVRNAQTTSKNTRGMSKPIDARGKTPNPPFTQAQATHRRKRRVLAR